MTLTTAAAWLLVTLCVALTFILGVATSTCVENARLRGNNLRLDVQHSAAMRTISQDLRECSLESEMYRQNYTFLAGRLSGLRLTAEVSDEIDKLDAFRTKLEKGYMQSQRRRRRQ